MPPVCLADFSTIWVSTLECGKVKKGLNRDGLSQLHELRQILGVAGRDADEVMG